MSMQGELWSYHSRFWLQQLASYRSIHQLTYLLLRSYNKFNPIDGKGWPALKRTCAKQRLYFSLEFTHQNTIWPFWEGHHKELRIICSLWPSIHQCLAMEAGYPESEGFCVYLDQTEPNGRKQYVLGDSGEVLLWQSDLIIVSIATDSKVLKQAPCAPRKLQLDTQESSFSKATGDFRKNSIKFHLKLAGGLPSRWPENEINFLNVFSSHLTGIPGICLRWGWVDIFRLEVFTSVSAQVDGTDIFQTSVARNRAEIQRVSPAAGQDPQGPGRTKRDSGSGGGFLHQTLQLNQKRHSQTFLHLFLLKTSFIRCFIAKAIIFVLEKYS